MTGFISWGIIFLEYAVSLYLAAPIPASILSVMNLFWYYHANISMHYLAKTFADVDIVLWFLNIL